MWTLDRAIPSDNGFTRHVALRFRVRIALWCSNEQTPALPTEAGKQARSCTQQQKRFIEVPPEDAPQSATDFPKRIAPVISRPSSGRLPSEFSTGQQGGAERARQLELRHGAPDRRSTRSFGRGSRRRKQPNQDGSEGSVTRVFRAPPGAKTEDLRRRNNEGTPGRRTAGALMAQGDSSRDMSRGSSRDWGQSKGLNEAIIEAGSRRSSQDILQLVADDGSSFNHVNIATALHRLGSCGLHPGGYEAKRLLIDPRFQQLERLAIANVALFDSRGTANCLWALAKLGYQPVTNIVATRGGEGGRLHAALCARIEVMDDLLGQSVAIILWALGSLGHHPGDVLLRKLTRRLVVVLPEVSPQGLANSLLGLAKLGWIPDRSVMEQLTRGSLPKIMNLNPQEVSNSLWSLARLGYRSDELQAAIFQQALTRLSEFHPQNISNLVWAAATLKLCVARSTIPSEAVGGACGSGDIPEELLRRCCDQAAASLQRYNPQNVANLAWATAKMGYIHKPFMCAVAEAGVKAAGGDSEARGAGRRSWGSQEITNTTWAFATLHLQPGDEFLNQVCDHLSSPSHLHSYNWQALATIVWALAVLGRCDKQALSAVEMEVADRMRAVAASAAGAAGDGLADQGHLRAMLLVPSDRDLHPQNVSNLMWGYARLRHPAPRLFAAMIPLLRYRTHLFDTLGISNCVWAAARLGVYDQEVMDIIAHHICDNCLPLLDPQGVANIAWAYSELRHERQDLFNGLVEALLHSMMADGGEGTKVGTVVDGSRAHVMMQDFTSTCCAASLFGWRYPALLDVVTQLLEVFVCHGRPQCYAGELCASIVLSPDVEVGGWRPSEGMRRLDMRALCNLVWSLSLVGAVCARVWGQVMELVGRMMSGGGSSGPGGGSVVELLAAENLAQIYQAYMHIQMDHPMSVLETGPPGLLERAADVRRLCKVLVVRVSDLQQQVAGSLTRLGLCHRVERLTDDGDFSIDLALELETPVKGRSAAAEKAVLPASTSDALTDAQHQMGPQAARYMGQPADGINFHSRGGIGCGVLHVAVEVDGPSHFTSNTRKPLSTTLYRRRCLEARGWRVVSVPYWQWDACASSYAKQDALLRELLRDAGLLGLLGKSVKQE